jgi:hypothetical protein
VTVRVFGYWFVNLIPTQELEKQKEKERVKQKEKEKKKQLLLSLVLLSERSTETSLS